jgi:D-lactate dehydrogenase (cytochrome)
VTDAPARGGTSTGEHGIGLGKIHHLVAEHSDVISTARRLKLLLDPNDILNPGKVLPGAGAEPVPPPP